MSGRRYDPVKRGIDIVVAAAGLALTAPVQLVVAALVRAKLGSPVLFRQRRPGRDGRPFTLVKFRTMLDVDEAHGLVADADRLTPFGAALRSTSLDELPTLWNVLRGDMSLVGPRPLLERYTPFFTPEERTRFDVRPGITGLAQVAGRNAVSWDDRLGLDVEYVRRRGAGLDGRIIWRTLRTVVRRDGFVAAPDTVMADLDVERSGRVL